MIYPSPSSVITAKHVQDVCKGMPNPEEQGGTVALFCLVAKKHDRWSLLQEELDMEATLGTFYWNGLLDAKWFQRESSTQRIHPTDTFFVQLEKNGLIETAEKKSKLKLFFVRVVYENKGERKSYFTLLDRDAHNAECTIVDRIQKFTHLIKRRGYIKTIDVTEIEGPFEAGQILHEER